MAKPGVSRRPPLGAHVSTGGGLEKAAARAARLGAEAVQIFSANPRQWGACRFADDDVRSFGDGLRRKGVPLFLHTLYLVNLASPDEGLRRRSSEAVAGALKFGALAAATAVVTHIGSHRGAGFEAGARHVAEAVAEASASAAPAGEVPVLLLEVSAGSGDSLGRTPAEMGRLLELADRRGVAAGVCLDTAHLYAAGFPIHETAGLDGYLAQLASETGPGRVGLVHLNDSRSALGSRADRHENLWEGEIGREGLARWVRHPALLEVPFVLEVPGFDGKGPDRRNLRRAKALRDRAVSPPSDEP